LKELSAEQTLNLGAGTHRISVLITRDSGDLEAFRVEILEGASAVVP
jgi:hypothetical protein